MVRRLTIPSIPLSLFLLIVGCSSPDPRTAPPLATSFSAVLGTSTIQPDASFTPTLTVTPTATVTFTPTVTPTPTTTPTPQPTQSPNAITAANADQITAAMILSAPRGEVWGIAASPDGTQIASGSTDSIVRVYDGITGEVRHELERHRQLVYSVAFSPDGQTLVSGSEDGSVQLWRPTTGERIFGARTSGEVFRVVFSPDGERFATGGFFSAIGELWQTTTGASLGLVEGHHTRLRSVAFDPIGRWLATGDESGRIIIRDSITAEMLFDLTTGGGEALSLAFTPDGRLFAATNQGRFIVWNVETREQLHTWAGHSGFIWQLIATPSGDMVISAGGDGAVRLWDTTTYERLNSLTTHGAPVRDVAISLDGATIASGGDDSRVIVWRLP